MPGLGGSRLFSWRSGQALTGDSSQVQAGRIVDNVVTEEIGLVPENYLALVEPHEGVVDWSSHDFEHEPEQLHEHEQEAEHTVKPAVGAAALSAEQAPHARSEAVPA